MTYPLIKPPSGNLLIDRTDYNIIQSQIDEILGLGPNGYGLPFTNSVPVTGRNQVTTSQWNLLRLDLNTIASHVYGTSTSIQPLTNSVTPITTTGHQTFYDQTNAIYSNDNLRYTCYPGGTYPSQFFNQNGEEVAYAGGISTSTTTVWYGSISHIYRAEWNTGLLARYFFNAGGIITWDCAFEPGATASLSDAEWASFLTYYRAGGYGQYEYKRSDWVDPSTTKVTTYSSGTKEIVITAVKNSITDIPSNILPTEVKFTVLLRDTALPEFIVAPGGYNLTPGP